MIESILTPEKMRKGIEEDNGKEKKRLENMALIYMEGVSITKEINGAKEKIIKGSGIQFQVTADKIRDRCVIDENEQFLPVFSEDVEGVLEVMIEIIRAAGHNVSQKDGGNGVRILEICPPTTDE